MNYYSRYWNKRGVGYGTALALVQSGAATVTDRGGTQRSERCERGVANPERAVVGQQRYRHRNQRPEGRLLLERSRLLRPTTSWRSFEGGRDIRYDYTTGSQLQLFFHSPGAEIRRPRTTTESKKAAFGIAVVGRFLLYRK